MSPAQPGPGAWASPVTAEAVVAASVGFSEVRVDGDDVYWAESRPDEGGRVQLVRRRADGVTADVLPEGFAARTRVHEYGGGAWAVHSGVVWFTNWADQRLYRLEPAADGVGPAACSPEPPTVAAHRYADFSVDDEWVFAVRERHDDPDHHEAVNEIVAVATDGSHRIDTLVVGPDFVSSPRLSPSGDLLAWVEWDHPNMPWDHTRLEVAPVIRSGDSIRLGPATTVAGAGAAESAILPVWRADGTLHYVSDATDWWNIYAVDPSTGISHAVTELRGEVGTPQWVFGGSRYGFLPDGRVVFACIRAGIDALCIRQPDGSIVEPDLPFTEYRNIDVLGDSVVAVASSPTEEEGVHRIGLAGDVEVSPIRVPRPPVLDATWIAGPRPIAFPSGPRKTMVYANHYAAVNPDAADGPRPILVTIHGGPTGMARPRLSLEVQFWTTRGFEVIDVNYRGSTGFGRPYRRSLDGLWGVADVEDCIAAVEYRRSMSGQPEVGAAFIRGGSAGGFTVLRAMQTSAVFSGGAIKYGVADLHTLAADTHKFEARYCDGLLAPYDDDPDHRRVYDDRSPINHVDDLTAPLIVFQGLDDAVVPPSQSEAIVAALEARGVPVEYHTYEGESHGFRKAETTIDVLEKELAFYQRILGAG